MSNQKLDGAGPGTQTADRHAPSASSTAPSSHYSLLAAFGLLAFGMLSAPAGLLALATTHGIGT